MEPTYLKISKRTGYFINKEPNPKHTKANCNPWPVGIPNIFGIDLENPNLIPDAVRILLLGPGVAYIIKLYTDKAKINSHVITVINL